MASHSQRPKGTEIATVFECEEAEWDDDEQDSLLVNMPAEQKRRITAERNCRDEGHPGWCKEELD